jgi:hypothetical protein
MPMKYVTLRLDGGELLPVLFPEFMQHAHMAQSVPATVVSAGRVHLENGKGHCQWRIKLAGCPLT